MANLHNTYPAFLKERYEREYKYFTVYDSYTPNFKRAVLTRKFYSKYEGLNDEDHKYVDIIPELINEIKKARYATPKEKHPWPSTENQWYGWFVEPMVEIDRNDRRFYHPKCTVDFVKQELKIKQEEAGLPKKAFTGVPFKIQ